MSGRYVLTGRTLGKGKFGQVFLATMNAGTGEDTNVAYKVIRIDTEKEAILVEREIDVLRAVAECPNTLRFIDASPVRDSNGDPFVSAYIVTEYYNGGTLTDVSMNVCQIPFKTPAPGRACPKTMILRVLRDISNALRCLHDAGYVHTDVKPDNILTQQNGVASEDNRKYILADFGLAKRVGEAHSCGTPRYMPLESFSKTTPADPSRDIFSLGVIAYTMMYGSSPFGAVTIPQIVTALKKREPPFNRFDGDDDSLLIDLVREMISRDPSQRPTARDLFDRVTEMMHN